MKFKYETTSIINYGTVAVTVANEDFDRMIRK